MLEPAREFVLVGGEGAIDGIAKHYHKFHMRHVMCDPLDGKRMVRVISARLECLRSAVSRGAAPGDFRQWKVTTVPPSAAVIIQVEVIYSLVEAGAEDLRVRGECPEERRRPATLAADQDEIGLEAKPCARRAGDHVSSTGHVSRQPARRTMCGCCHLSPLEGSPIR